MPRETSPRACRVFSVLCLLQVESFGKHKQKGGAIAASSSAMSHLQREGKEFCKKPFAKEFSGSQVNTEVHPETSLPRCLGINILCCVLAAVVSRT